MPNNSAIGDSWEDVRRELFTPEEITASDDRVSRLIQLLRECRRLGLSKEETQLRIDMFYTEEWRKEESK
jgi:hypothetical protein